MIFKHDVKNACLNYCQVYRLLLELFEYGNNFCIVFLFCCPKIQVASKSFEQTVPTQTSY